MANSASGASTYYTYYVQNPTYGHNYTYNYANTNSVSQAPYPYQFPDTAIGKLFIRTNPNGARFDSDCTASVWNSPGRDLIVTAGHCVNDGNGHFYSDFVFVPGYNGQQSGSAAAPCGQYHWVNVATTYSWNGFANAHDDFAVIQLAPNTNGPVQVCTGGMGFIWNLNQKPGLFPPYDTWIHGYPVNYNNGQTQTACSGMPRATEDWGGTIAPQDSSQYRTNCGMLHGSSGGPVYTKHDWIVYSVVSIGQSGDQWNPWLGPEARDTFNVEGGGR
jgi:hypothetical protein